MHLHDLSPVLTADGPFVTVLVDSESDVEQAAATYDLVTLDLLADDAQERGQGERAVDGLPDVVEGLRQAQVPTLLLTTQTDQGGSLWFGPAPTQIATSGRELVELGVADPQEGPMIDVLIRAAVGTAADVQLAPGELTNAPATGIGAVLRSADSLATVAP